jgi:hypothetical protein
MAPFLTKGSLYPYIPAAGLPECRSRYHQGLGLKLPALRQATNYLLVLFVSVFVLCSSSEPQSSSSSSDNAGGIQKQPEYNFYGDKYLSEEHQRTKRATEAAAAAAAIPVKAFKDEADDVCAHAPNKNLCLPESYSKFELPHVESVNVVEIGIDIIDVLRINDKVSSAMPYT